MMTEMLILALLAGAVLGVFFFGGLWWTVHKGLVAKTPALWFLLSYLLRMSVVVSGFLWIARNADWLHLSMALIGFIMVRIILTRYLPPSKEVTHAS